MDRLPIALKQSLLTLSLVLGFLTGAFSQTGPRPGEIYREYAVNLRSGDNWRVTDPAASHSGAAQYLPNPVLSIHIGDLDQAVRAEVLMDIWGGHPGTSGRRFRFNGNDWIDIPRPRPIKDRDICYLFQYNAILDLPLEHLQEGENTFQGNSSGQLCRDFGWGQWGWYVMMVRIYYHPDKAHSKGRIISPVGGDTLHNPVIRCALDDSLAVSEVQFLGNYLGYDEDGDGYFKDWHRAYHGPDITGHIGTAGQSPWAKEWNTRYIPDQAEKSISLVARIRDTTGIWYVTETVDSLSLYRPDSVSVKMFHNIVVPAPFWVRAGNTQSCTIRIDRLEDAMEAHFHHRTWNAGDDEAAGGTVSRPLRINGSPYYCKGRNHFFAHSARGLTVADLKEGSNVISYTSNTAHHGIEVLWPGPSIIIRYVQGGNKVADPAFSPEDSTLFLESFSPAISSATEGAVILVTTNGRDPNTDDLRFRPGILQVDRDMVIKARAYKGDHFQSEVSTAHYLLDRTGLDPRSSEGILFFPNPAGDHITLIGPDQTLIGPDQTRILQYRISDSSGSILQEGEVPGDGRIHTGHLPRGNHILSILSEERIFSGKLILLER